MNHDLITAARVLARSAEVAQPSIIQRGVAAVAAEIAAMYAEGGEMDAEDAEDIAALPTILAAEGRMMSILDDDARCAVASVDPKLVVTVLLTGGLALSLPGGPRNAIYKMYKQI